MEIVFYLVVILFLSILVYVYVPIGLWFSARMSGVSIPLGQLTVMRFRRVPATLIVNNMVAATSAGLDLNWEDLETHYLAGGDVTKVVKALIVAHKANIEMTVKTATAIDLAGRDVTGRGSS